jgi:hypothetical protein
MAVETCWPLSVKVMVRAVVIIGFSVARFYSGCCCRVSGNDGWRWT